MAHYECVTISKNPIRLKFKCNLNSTYEVNVLCYINCMYSISETWNVCFFDFFLRMYVFQQNYARMKKKLKQKWIYNKERIRYRFCMISKLLDGLKPYKFVENTKAISDISDYLPSFGIWKALVHLQACRTCEICIFIRLIH